MGDGVEGDHSFGEPGDDGFEGGVDEGFFESAFPVVLEVLVAPAPSQELIVGSQEPVAFGTADKQNIADVGHDL